MWAVGGGGFQRGLGSCWAARPARASWALLHNMPRSALPASRVDSHRVRGVPVPKPCTLLSSKP